MSMIKLAEAQILGFSHASRGYSAKDLATSMNLTKKEWIKIRKSVDMKQADKEEIDSMFLVPA